jgi:hypothetical protein
MAEWGVFSFGVTDIFQCTDLPDGWLIACIENRDIGYREE